MILFTFLFWVIVLFASIAMFNIIIGGLIGSGMMDKIKNNLWFFVFLIVLFTAVLK